MALLDYDELKNSVAAGKIKNAYFIFGNDAYMKKQCVNKIIGSVTERDDVFNFITFGESATVREMSDAAEQLPLMSDKKCILLEDFDIEKADKSTIDSLCELISNLPDTTVFIIWCNNIEFEYKKSDKAKKIAAAIDKCGGFAAQIDHLTPDKLRKMLVSGAAKRGITLRNFAADYLVENCGEDINVLKSELEKLCSFVGSGEITKEIIDKVCVKTVEASVYELSRRIFSLNTDGTIALLDELFYLKTEPAVILHSIFTAFIDAYRVYSGLNAGVGIPSVAADFGYGKRDFVLTRIKSTASKMSDKKFNLCFEEILAADEKLKGFSSDPRTVIEELAVKLIYVLSKDEKIND